MKKLLISLIMEIPVFVGQPFRFFPDGDFGITRTAVSVFPGQNREIDRNNFPI